MKIMNHKSIFSSKSHTFQVNNDYLQENNQMRPRVENFSTPTRLFT